MSASDLLVPEGARLVHIGPYKTGSTALQSALHQARPVLADHGVRRAGDLRQETLAVLHAVDRIRPYHDAKRARRRWERLAAKGATAQRCLWASTSTKNPEYRDVMYVEDLIGPETVDTMPLDTIEAFLDHGNVQRTVDRDVDDARRRTEHHARGFHIRQCCRFQI